MGTRHLICVVLGGEYKIAQYGQWDGYPSGQGVTILNTLKGMVADLNSMDTFKAKAKELSFFTDAEFDSLCAEVEDKRNADKNYDWTKEYPHLCRDTGADILKMVLFAEEPLKLKNSFGFGYDGLFCEYAYVIDLDTMKLEIYQGGHKDEVTEGRWLSRDITLTHVGQRPEYSCVKKIHEFNIHDLPAKDDFLRILSEKEV